MRPPAPPASPPLPLASPPVLPSPVQSWSHCTITPALLAAALADPAVTAIEADILMSEKPEVVPPTDPDEPPAPPPEPPSEPPSSPPSSPPFPVMAHPPSRDSDLPFADFLRACLANDPPKHVKCDFKEPEVSIFLNADVLPGPGKRGDPPTMPADAFVEACLSLSPPQPLSLGWSTNVARVYNPTGYYLPADAGAMRALCEKHGLPGRAPVVFAANFRVAMRDPTALKGLLGDLPGTQLLLWTGTGEPAVRGGEVEAARDYFEREGLLERVGFDCLVAGGGVEAAVAASKIVVINVINWFRGLV